MAWRPARSLVRLRGQVQSAYWWAAPPATPATSWGLIGDPRTHAATSDHMPKTFPGWGTEIVTAADLPHRPDLGLDIGPVLEAIRLSHDPRIKYVIFNRRQYSSYPMNGVPPYTWRPYAGSNPHTDHGHLSVVGDGRADGEQPWRIGAVDVTADEVVQALLANPNVQSWMWRIRSTVQLEDPVPHTMEPGEPNRLAQRLEEILTAVRAPIEVTLTPEQFDALEVRLTAALRNLINHTSLTTSE